MKQRVKNSETEIYKYLLLITMIALLKTLKGMMTLLLGMPEKGRDMVFLL